MLDMRKLVGMAQRMKESSSSFLDISEIDEGEAMLITAMVKNDSLFQFFSEVQDIPLRKLASYLKYLEREEEQLKLLREIQEM